MHFGTSLQPGDDLIHAFFVREVAVHLLIPAFEWMDVRVMDAWHRHAAVQIDDLGVRPDIFLDVLVTANGHDGAIVNRRGFGPTAVSINCVDATIEQNDVGRIRGGRCATGDEN